MDKKNIVKECIVIFWVFTIGSVLGYLVETVVVLVQKGYFESRQGLIYGPFTPVYGIGAVVYYLILNNIHTKSKVKIFLITAVLGGLTEYLCSFVQEELFGTISWDYSHLMFNINGRTSLLHCTYWGLAGILYAQFIAPFLENLKQQLDEKRLKIFTTIMALMLLVDILVTSVAANRQTERRNHIEAKNRWDKLCDQYYPDEYMDKVYTNKKEVLQRK